MSDVRVAGTQSVRRAKRSPTGVVEVIRHMEFYSFLLLKVGLTRDRLFRLRTPLL